jgi:sugar-specific transcriptional regulator TrmB
VIDQIRHDIQARLDQLLAEADKLHRALAALDPREQSTTARAQRAKPLASKERTTTTPSSLKTVPSQSPSARTRTGAASVPARSASGATKAKVLSALSNDGGLTAGEVAKATGLGRATVSTTLSNLAKRGTIAKAERGYRLPDSAPARGLA